MGPSGAGKSTLLYALMGTARYGTTRGRLWVNGREMRLARLRRILGYVPQVSHTPLPGSWLLHDRVCAKQSPHVRTCRLPQHASLVWHAPQRRAWALFTA